MGRFNDEMIRAGVLVAAEGLDDADEGVVVDYSSEPPVVTDGPYGETKELFGGFYLLDVASKEEAVEWAKRMPAVTPAARPRSAACLDRRVPAGQRVGRQGAGLARAHRPAVSDRRRPAPAGRPSRRSGGSSRRGSSVRWPATPATSRWPRTSPRRRWREALVTWPRDGVPAIPAGWLLTVGRRRAIDAFRRRSALDERYAALARDLGEGGVSPAGSADPAREGDEVLWDPDQIDDDVLALMFVVLPSGALAARPRWP